MRHPGFFGIILLRQGGSRNAWELLVLARGQKEAPASGVGILQNVLKKNRQIPIAAILILFATGLRVLLAAFNWPATNSDEGTMAIMAMNIAARRDYPFIYYGQSYMGTLEAWLGAILFRLTGGPSLFALRLGVILLVALFLVSIYLLTRLIFDKRLALLTLFILIFGSSSIFMRHIIATGGSVETLVCGSLAFLFAAWLGFTYPGKGREPSRALFWRRLSGYWAWGLVVGMALWSDMVALPFVVMAFLLLALFCWRDLLPWRWLVVGSGFVVGSAPLLWFDWQHKLNPFKILFGLSEGSNTKAPTTVLGILHNIFSTLRISLPIATGQPFCPVMEVPAWGPTSPNSLTCKLVGASWGSGYVLLLVAGLLLALLALRQLHFHVRDVLSFKRAEIDDQEGRERYQEIVRTFSRFFLLGAAGLSLGVYTLSSGPVDQPGFHARYLVSLLIATPAILSSLWYAATRLKLAATFVRVRTYAARGALAVIWLLLLTGTILTLLDIPTAQASAQRKQDLVHDLQKAGITHFYTDYWSCYDLIVASNERVICAVLDPPSLRPTHNRAPRYYDIVHNDRAAALVFPKDSPQLVMAECQFVGATPTAYQRFTSGDYVIYKPILNGTVQPTDLHQAIGPDGVQKWRPGCGPVAATSGK
jgi:4-amino-4-deoxy-L-arabinose transferase-like glycosyltransferase